MHINTRKVLLEKSTAAEDLEADHSRKVSGEMMISFSRDHSMHPCPGRRLWVGDVINDQSFSSLTAGFLLAIEIDNYHP